MLSLVLIGSNHSHYKPQRVDGFYGYIIIKDADKSYVDLADDDENAEDPCPYCVLISDWYHAWANTLLNAYHYCNDSPKTTVEPVPHSIVINGKGAGNCMGATPVNSVVAPDVEGMRVKDQYKNHTLLPLSVGQRYSVIASTDDNETSDFWMRIQTSLSCIRSTTPCDEKKMLVKEIRAIVHYGDESVDVPKTEPYVNVNNDTELKDKLPCIDFEYGLLSPADGSSAEESEDKLALPFGIYMTTINSTKNYIYTTYGSIALTSDSDLFKEYGSQIYDPELNVIVLNNYGQLIDVIITIGMMAQFVELPLELPNLEPSDETIFIDKIGQTVTLTPWRDLCQEPEYTNPTGDEDWKQYCNSFISNVKTTPFYKLSFLVII
ncbi:3001_t:CDS:2, partial [Racocetra fulgida]